MKKVAITREQIRNMAVEMSTRTYYDADDCKQGKTPMFEHPQVEKAIIKWFKRFGIEILET